MKISIPQPCHENWNEMLADEKGRFCQSCQKCVIDFTKLSDKEILNYSERNICVKISNNQIDRINSRKIFQIPNWLRYSSLLIAMGLNSVIFAQNNNSKIKYTTSQIEELQKQDSTIVIKLQVIDGFDETPISDAKVYLNKRKRKYSTKTDKNGYFELEIPTKYLYDDLTIEKDYLKDRFQIGYLLNQDRIGLVLKILIGRIDFNKAK
ncbi:hypothetical protein [Moheibacter lacus]|uniref:Carboxypeptidase regulatory-like domain-containing protein n=1 Tax=Moheibacter lacus TaxID=2745851 RepID=A0A838ZMS9_9FLAO|nr:hypothetical protein [Moheibacter lacus]MBA5629864.1 hypothetical protein [Moheibacter lacus]